MRAASAVKLLVRLAALVGTPLAALGIALAVLTPICTPVQHTPPAHAALMYDDAIDASASESETGPAQAEGVSCPPSEPACLMQRPTPSALATAAVEGVSKRLSTDVEARGPDAFPRPVHPLTSAPSPETRGVSRT